ncbi:RNA ligase partner protein [Candidatus Micrarchaeota archaeon]|nr:RNA ligase partner protein [Candidatus Micrarchaeota archaeon]
MKYVIDTSLFVNPISRSHFGKTPSDAVKSFIKKAEQKGLQIYMPPSVFSELANFVDAKTMNALDIAIKKRSPNTYAIYLPAAVLYDFINDMRTRVNRGIRLAEDFAADNTPNNDEKIRKLREKYRGAMRAGIVDSVEDFEMVLLAKELEATLITCDEGAIKFANQIGVEWLGADKFYDLIKKS